MDNDFPSSIVTPTTTTKETAKIENQINPEQQQTIQDKPAIINHSEDYDDDVDDDIFESFHRQNGSDNKQHQPPNIAEEMNMEKNSNPTTASVGSGQTGTNTLNDLANGNFSLDDQPISFSDPEFQSIVREQRQKQRKAQYTSTVRVIMYSFIFFYLFMALLIWLNNLKFLHRETLLSQILHLKISEYFMQQLFELQAILLFFTGILGLIALYKKGFRLFMAFSALIFFTLIFTLIIISFSIKSYNRMNDNIDNRRDTINLIVEHIKTYDWIDLSNGSSQFINKLQFEYECCGGEHGYHDWEASKPKNFSYGIFPFSCCKENLSINNDVLFSYCTYPDVEKMPGCTLAFTKHLVDIQNIFYTMNILLVESFLIQLFSIIIFFYLIFYQRNLFAF